MCALKYIPIPEKEGSYSYFKINEDFTLLLEKQIRSQWYGTLPESLS